MLRLDDGFSPCLAASTSSSVTAAKLIFESGVEPKRGRRKRSMTASYPMRVDGLIRVWAYVARYTFTASSKGYRPP
jgi:hypothetical protein